ncbi:MAG: hypothetical protein ABI698_00045 [bacterium]
MNIIRNVCVQVQLWINLTKFTFLLRRHLTAGKPAYKFAVCINNADYPASLEVHKISRVLADEGAAIDGDVRLVDDSGEDYLYPAMYFVLVDSTSKCNGGIGFRSSGARCS